MRDSVSIRAQPVLAAQNPDRLRPLSRSAATRALTRGRQGKVTSMAKPTTERAHQHPLPPFTHWDQRGNPVLLTDLKLMDGKKLRLSLKTQDSDIARGHMRFLVAMLVFKGSLSPNSGGVRVYGPKGTDRSRLTKIYT